jgi:glycosyltransferase involved in cell wall biosynthesis
LRVVTPGALVDVAKVSELASTMINLAQAPGIWQQLRARAFVLAKDRFSISRVATDYIRELIDLCP